MINIIDIINTTDENYLKQIINEKLFKIIEFIEIKYE